MSEAPKIEWEDESHSDRLLRKARNSPFMIIGIGGLLTACAIGAYKYKTRGSMSTSVFLMQLRVAAQGTVVACLSAGMAYHMYQTFMEPDPVPVQKDSPKH